MLHVEIKALAAKAHLISNPEVLFSHCNSRGEWAPTGFFKGWAMRGSEGRRSPSGVQGQIPGRGLGRSPQKLTTFSQNNAQILHLM